MLEKTCDLGVEDRRHTVLPQELLREYPVCLSEPVLFFHPQTPQVSNASHALHMMFSLKKEVSLLVSHVEFLKYSESGVSISEDEEENVLAKDLNHVLALTPNKPIFIFTKP